MTPQASTPKDRKIWGNAYRGAKAISIIGKGMGIFSKLTYTLLAPWQLRGKNLNTCLHACHFVALHQPPESVDLDDHCRRRSMLPPRSAFEFCDSVGAWACTHHLGKRSVVRTLLFSRRSTYFDFCDHRTCTDRPC